MRIYSVVVGVTQGMYQQSHDYTVSARSYLHLVAQVESKFGPYGRIIKSEVVWAHK